MIESSIQVIRTAQEARDFRLQCTLQGRTVGFVPTMGALHDGHCSLVLESLRKNDITIVSIFVNPSQFAPTEDLNSYPRTFEEDMQRLETLEIDGKTVDVIFAPTVDEMYPNKISLVASEQKGAFVTVLGLSEQLEGASRPQFFKGVATVVTKLFNVINPTRAYFGAKDIQQTIVIKRMVQDLLMAVEIVVMPTVREESGLALSSRNAYLSTDIKQQSATIYEALHEGELFYYDLKIACKASDILDKIYAVLEPYINGKRNSFKIDYIKINHPTSLDELDEIDSTVGGIISTAIFVPRADGGQARLIDNIVLAPK